MRTTHQLKVLPPYMDALLAGSKTFEVRRNDRGYQRGDVLVLREWHPARYGDESCHRCRNQGWNGHYPDEGDPSIPDGSRTVDRVITYIYSGDPRLTGLEPGHVILALGEAS